MTTPEDKSIVERAISNMHSYEEAAERVQRSFERNRLIFGHHVKAILSPDIFGDNRKDLLRMQGRLEQHVQGMQQSNGYTLEQFLIAHYELNMAPKLLASWRNYSHEALDPPSLDELLKFIDKQLLILPDERLHVKQVKIEKPASPAKPPSFKKAVLKVQPSQERCALCSSNHTTFTCSDLKNKSVFERQDLIRNRGLYFNCLNGKHRSSVCLSQKRCKTCGRRHHTFLHSDQPAQPAPASDPAVETVARVSRHVSSKHCVLPRTALVIATSRCRQQKAQVQMDSGASVNLISSRTARALEAPRLHNSASIIKGVSGDIHSPLQVRLSLQSVYDHESIQ